MSDFDYKDQTFGYYAKDGQGVEWRVPDIIEHVKGIYPSTSHLKPFKEFLEYTVSKFTTDDWLRTNAADTSYPVILGTGSFKPHQIKNAKRIPIILDGVHRMVKLHLEGQTVFTVIKTSTLPPPTIVGKFLRIESMYYDNPEIT